MNLWPFRRTETRSSATDTLIAALLARASGTTPATVTATGAVEAAAGLYGRAFAGATVEGPAAFAAALGPSVLRTVGRELVRRGEAVSAIGVSAESGLTLTPAGTWNVTGGDDPAGWRYRVDLNGPSRTQTVELAAASVLHFRYGVDPARPWHGLGPIQFADIAGRLSAETDNALAGEAGGPMANLLPIPVDGQHPTVAALRKDIAAAKGKALTVETTANDWAAPTTGTAARRMDWRAERLGANPPAPLVDLSSRAERSVLAACGVPVELVDSNSGMGDREAWRRFLFGSVAPLAKIIEEELRAKLDPGVGLQFPELRASDLAGRARAYKQLTEAGVAETEARAICGF